QHDGDQDNVRVSGSYFPDCSALSTRHSGLPISGDQPYNPRGSFPTLRRQFVVPRILLSLALLAACIPFAACGNDSEAHISRPKPVADPSADSDSDGLPDRAELRLVDDRQSFRRWFAAIAEMQFYKTSDEWNKDQRDCAGLIRFAWREALRKHDRLWFQRMGAEYAPIASDVKAYNSAPNPLGEKLFRTDFGSYQESDVSSGKFSEFADARTLKNFNCVFLGKDRRRVERGDLLFFQQPFVQEFPYHAMLFII